MWDIREDQILKGAIGRSFQSNPIQTWPQKTPFLLVPHRIEAADSSPSSHLRAPKYWFSLSMNSAIRLTGKLVNWLIRSKKWTVINVEASVSWLALSEEFDIRSLLIECEVRAREKTVSDSNIYLVTPDNVNLMHCDSLVKEYCSLAYLARQIDTNIVWTV